MRITLAIQTMLLFGATVGLPASAAAQSYDNLRGELARQHTAMREAFGDNPLGEAQQRSVRATVMAGIETLFDAWEGTRWGMGLPQTQTPGAGKINCGMFVGTVLVHAGFEIDHKKLQRQPAELIIKSLAPSGKIERFRHAPMDDFLAGVRKHGPGLYIIGLDYHVGFLVVGSNGGIRYVHSSVVTGEVVDMKAAGAPTIVQSKYRVVGKILQGDMIQSWLSGREIPVLGDW